MPVCSNYASIIYKLARNQPLAFVDPPPLVQKTVNLDSVFVDAARRDSANILWLLNFHWLLKLYDHAGHARKKSGPPTFFWRTTRRLGSNEEFHALLEVVVLRKLTDEVIA